MPVIKTSQKAHARYLYFNTALLQKQIAAATKVSERTMQRWVATEKWAEQKKAAYYSPNQVQEQVYGELHKIDNIINARGEEAIPTKEEMDLRTKIVNLINSLQKNGSTSWRNIAPEYDFENKDIVDLDALGALERKNLEKRKQAAEEDARKGPGKRFSEEELNEYYIKVANLKFGADSESAKFSKDGKPLTEDDPQRLKWEERMRQGKRPFVDDDEENEKNGGSGEDGENGSGAKKSGRRSEDGRSNDDLPEGETWMDMPEDDE
jgi:hypothetical protein